MTPRGPSDTPKHRIGSLDAQRSPRHLRGSFARTLAEFRIAGAPPRRTAARGSPPGFVSLPAVAGQKQIRQTHFWICRKPTFSGVSYPMARRNQERPVSATGPSRLPGEPGFESWGAATGAAGGRAPENRVVRVTMNEVSHRFPGGQNFPAGSGAPGAADYRAVPANHNKYGNNSRGDGS